MTEWVTCLTCAANLKLLSIGAGRAMWRFKLNFLTIFFCICKLIGKRGERNGHVSDFSLTRIDVFEIKQHTLIRPVPVGFL
jgi:hypothetical protein